MSNLATTNGGGTPVKATSTNISSANGQLSAGSSTVKYTNGTHKKTYVRAGNTQITHESWESNS